jgi:ElaB/YqjD/DUF883 family membrane-anchored ribosome-binding protein
MTQTHIEPTYRDLIEAADTLFHAGAHASHDEEAELRASIDRLIDANHSMADVHDMDAIRRNAQLL